MNRGSPKPVRPAKTTVLASMRPRFMNRGSLRGEAPTQGWQSSFNEAPIHESGK